VPLTDESPKMSLVNTVTGEGREVQFNPEQFTQSIAVNYAKLQVVGLSHTRKHYINTDDVKFDLEIGNNVLAAGDGGISLLARLLEDHDFLYSLTHPRRADSIARGGPPRVMFIWPNFISLTCVLMNLTFTYSQFNKEGTPTAWRAKITLEEIRDTFVSMEDIRQLGTQRSNAATATSNDTTDTVDPATVG